MNTATKSGSKAILLALLLLPVTFFASAQLNYSFSVVTTTYAANGGTVLIGASTDDATSAATNIGFTFTYNCNTYTQFMVSSNGWMVLGTGMTGAMTGNALGTTGQGPILAPLWDDMATSSTGNVNYKVTGTAGSRVLTVEWLNMLWDYNAAGPVMSYQVNLYEATGVVEFVYRRDANTINNGSASIGINSGTSSTDFYSVNTTPTAAYGTETIITTTRPTGNRIYRWTPQAMTYTSSNVVQASTANVSKTNYKDQVILGVQVVTGGGCPALSLTQFSLNMLGSTIPGTSTVDVTKIHIYYTGNISVFAPVNEFLAGGTTPATGTITVNGSQTLAGGTNYFWVAYDINPATAVASDVVDGRCTSITLSSGAQTPTTTAPAGSRTIVASAVAPGGITGMSFWIKGNAGTSTTTNGSAVSSWNDQSGNTRNATQGTAANQPKYYDNSTNNTNFNPVVDFDDASSSYMDIVSNGILSTGANPYTVYAVIKPGPNNLSSPGKYLFAGATGVNNFNSFDVRAGNALNDSWDINDLIVGGVWTPAYPSMATYDYNTIQREMFISGASAGTKVGTNRASPDANNALGCQRSAAPMIEYYDGSIAEIITYANYSHNATQHNQVESYLGIKYGVTLQHDYLSSTGATVWSRSLNAAYNTNITGIARDDNSALSQKESKSTSTTQDMLTVYIGPSKTVNQANNTGSFLAGDKSFFIAANNNAPYFYPWGTPVTEVPAGICCRLNREWLAQKTNFTNTDLKLEFDFNVITPGYSPLNLADLRLLVDADGDFTNATILNSPAITISVASSVVTITVPAANFTATPYFTLASVSTATSLPVNITGFDGTCKNNTVQLGWTKQSGPTNTFTMERSTDGIHFGEQGVLQSTGPQSYTWQDKAPLPGISYYRLKISGAELTTSYSSVVTVNGCSSNNLQLTANAVTGESTLIMQLQQNAMVDINLFDMLGRRYDISGLTGHHAMQQGYYQMPVTGHLLAKGVYVLEVVVNGNKNVYRVVQH